jgi:thiamine transport system substrate-binding protein
VKHTPLFLLVFCFLFASCSPRTAVLTIMTHDSFSISEDLVTSFEQANNVKLVFLASGDSGSALNKAILSKKAPLADVFFGVDNTFLSRALEEGIFEPYASPLLDEIPDEFELDPGHYAVPVDYGDVCINFDKVWFAAEDLAVPSTLEELLEPEYDGLLVVENPATSSPGLAFMLATISHFGEDGYLSYWSSLRDNGLVVVDGWETAYYTNFSGSSAHGPQPMVVSYASSPAAEVIYADPPVNEAKTASILAPATCYRQIEFVGILSGTRNESMAKKFVDFMLSTQFQQDIPLQMFMYPVNPVVQLPPEFVKWAQVAEQPAFLDPALIAAHRDAWIAAWADVVLR